MCGMTKIFSSLLAVFDPRCDPEPFISFGTVGPRLSHFPGSKIIERHSSDFIGLRFGLADIAGAKMSPNPF
jgi:hypothetical protein